MPSIKYSNFNTKNNSNFVSDNSVDSHYNSSTNSNTTVSTTPTNNSLNNNLNFNKTQPKRSSKYYTCRNSKDLNKEFEKYGYNINTNFYTHLSAGMVPNPKSSHINEINSPLVHNHPNSNYYYHLNSNQQQLTKPINDSTKQHHQRSTHRNSRLATITPASVGPQLGYDFTGRPLTVVNGDDKAKIVDSLPTLSSSTTTKQEGSLNTALDKRYSMNIMGCNSPSCKQHQMTIPPPSSTSITNKPNSATNKIGETCLTYSYFSNKNYTLGRKINNNKKEDRNSVVVANGHLKEGQKNGPTLSVKESINNSPNTNDKKLSKNEEKMFQEMVSKLNVIKSHLTTPIQTNLETKDFKNVINLNEKSSKQQQKPSNLNPKANGNSSTENKPKPSTNKNKNHEKSKEENCFYKQTGASTVRPKHFSMYIESINTKNGSTKQNMKTLVSEINRIYDTVKSTMPNNNKSTVKVDDLYYNEQQINSFNKKLHNLPEDYDTFKSTNKKLSNDLNIRERANTPGIITNRNNTEKHDNDVKTVKFNDIKEKKVAKSSNKNNSSDDYESISKTISEKINKKNSATKETVDEINQINDKLVKQKQSSNTKVSNTNTVTADLDNLEKLANALKEHTTPQNKQLNNRGIDVEKANQLYMKYFTTNGKLIKQQNFVEPIVKKQIEIELSKNLDAKLVKTDEKTKIVITTTSINSDEKTEEIEKTAYFSSLSEDDEDGDLNNKKSVDDKAKISENGDIIIKENNNNDNHNQSNINNSKEIEKIFNDFSSNRFKRQSQTENPNNENKSKRNGQIFDDIIEYTNNLTNRKEKESNLNAKVSSEPSQNSSSNTCNTKTSNNNLVDKRKTPVTMLRKIATPPPLPHILDKLRYNNLNELLSKRSSKCGDNLLMSPCSQSKTSQATISNMSDNIQNNISDHSNNNGSGSESKHLSENDEKTPKRMSLASLAQTPILTINQEIDTETNKIKNQIKSLNESKDSKNLSKKNNNENSNLVIKSKEDSLINNAVEEKSQKTVSNNLKNKVDGNLESNMNAESNKNNSKKNNTKNSVSVDDPKTPAQTKTVSKEKCDPKSTCKKHLNGKSNELADNSHYSIRQRFEGLSEMDRLREEKRPKSAFPYKEPVKAKPKLNNHHYLVTPFDNLASLKTAAQSNYYAAMNIPNQMNNTLNQNQFNNYHTLPNNNMNGNFVGNNQFLPQQKQQQQQPQQTKHNNYNDEKFFENFLNQISNNKDSKNDRNFYKYYAKENDRRKREGNGFLMLLPGIAIPIDTDAGESDDDLSSSASN